MKDYKVIYKISHKGIDLFFVISKQKNAAASKYFGYKQSFYLDSISFLPNYHKQLCDSDILNETELIFILKNFMQKRDFRKSIF